MLKVVIKIRLVHFHLTRNVLGWKEGTHTLEVQYRGSKDELKKLLKSLIEDDLA